MRDGMTIKKVGVIGAGTMGSGIAQRIAQEGIEVVMVDTEERFVQKGMRMIRETLNEGVERGIFTPERAEEVLRHIHGTTELEAVMDANIVIEAVFEDMKVKEELFRRLDAVCEPNTILASNTSSFSIAALAEAVHRRERFIGLHFFYHPAKNRLLEIVPTRETSPDALLLAEKFTSTIGKIGIDVKDAPGFAVNRFFVPWLNEATRLVGEGKAEIPTVDAVAKSVFGIGLGPFALMNATGIPVAYHSAVSLGEHLGSFYSPSALLRRQFEKGEPWELRGESDPDAAGIVEERLLGAVFTIACQAVEEGVARMEDMDRGAKIGLRWRYGPFEMMNRYGIERAYAVVESFTRLHPELRIPANLRERYERREGWQISYVDLVIKDGIARIIFNRPEAMNAINEEVMRQLEERFREAESDPAVDAILLEGAGKAFVAGADIQYFIDKIDAGKIEDIVAFTKSGHAVLQRIDRSEKQVIAKLDGLALGGGAEIALAADTIVATEKGSIGFPETGIGIYPGLGGTQRTPRYIGKELAKYMVLTGKILDARSAAAIGLVEYVVPSEDADRRIAALVRSRDVLRKSNREEVVLSEEFEKIKEQFSDANIGRLLSGEAQDPLGQTLWKTISGKAPLAVKLANKLVDDGTIVDLNEGLQMEIAHLTEIFSTRDAYEGLRSVLEKRRPVFKGE
ncbi:MAG: 3-hydroxyacyl-CoA dehydrogenase NAD-binding domain-containing protein [Candidatus Thermoplasmatota archaeon]